MGSNHFIVKPSDAPGGSEYLMYRHIVLKDDSLYVQKSGFEDFFCHNPKSVDGYTVRQDIDYHAVGSKEKFYVILYKEEHEYAKAVSGNCNIILVYNLAGECGYYQNKKCFEPIEMFVTKKKNMNSYEVEGMAFPSLTSAEFPFYISANADNDAIYEVNKP